MEDLKAQSINKVVEKAVNKTAFVLTSGYKGCLKLKEKNKSSSSCNSTQ